MKKGGESSDCETTARIEGTSINKGTFKSHHGPKLSVTRDNLDSPRTYSPSNTFPSDMGFWKKTKSYIFKPNGIDTYLSYSTRFSSTAITPHLLYLSISFAIFSQVAIIHEENDAGVEALVCMFGGWIHHEPRMEGEVMICWCLRRWGPISESVFDVIEDAKMGALQDQQHMHRSVDKPSTGYIPLGHSLSNGEAPNNSSVVILPKSDLLALILLPTTSPLKVGLNPKTSNDFEDLEKSLNYDILAPPAGSSLDNETFDIQIDTVIDGESVPSAIMLDERLLDVSMPTLLHQTFPIGRFNDDDDNFRSALQPASLGQQIKLVNSLHELSKERLRNSDLESRIEGLELALELERKKAHEKDIKSGLDSSDGYGGLLEVARKEILWTLFSKFTS
ncbi:hypothetical protein BYT27DRAFT_7262363 [Phlegmacium glaucopus]|nr:hypothetical protein BYT27DRAFT_7262363 [Phlegmacium glaucopus]